MKHNNIDIITNTESVNYNRFYIPKIEKSNNKVNKINCYIISNCFVIVVNKFELFYLHVMYDASYNKQ